LAIVNHNRIMAYMVLAEVYEAIIDRLDDLALVDIAASRANEKGVPVNFEDLSTAL
jgi:antitoxin StbD